MPDDILLDTNVVLRAFDPDYPEHAHVKVALTSLTMDDYLLCFVPQVAYETRHVLTREKKHNGFGLSASEAAQWLTRFENLFQLRFPDAHIEYQIFCELAVELEPMGENVHDLRLVAAAQALGVRKLLTLDSSDFKKADAAGHVDVLTPAAVTERRAPR